MDARLPAPRHYPVPIVGAGVKGARAFRNLALQGVDCLMATAATSARARRELPGLESGIRAVGLTCEARRARRPGRWRGTRRLAAEIGGIAGGGARVGECLLRRYGTRARGVACTVAASDGATLRHAPD